MSGKLKTNQEGVTTHKYPPGLDKNQIGHLGSLAIVLGRRFLYVRTRVFASLLL